MSLLDKIVASGRNEKLINKKLGEYSYNAAIQAK
jgi:hypothetical protein